MARSLKAAALGCAIGMFGLYSSPTYAQAACLPMAEVEKMAEKFKELPVSFGKAEGGWTLTIWANADGKTWTAVMVSPDGRMACPLPGVYGTDWVPGELSGKGA